MHSTSRWALALALTLVIAPMMAPSHALAWEWFRSENAHVRDGNTALRGGDAAGASAQYDQAARELPREPGVQLNRGLALLAQGEQHGPAREAFLRATEPPAPREMRASSHYDAGLSFYQEGDAAAGTDDHRAAQESFRQAAEQFRQSLRQVPGNRDAAWNLELALRRLNEEEEEQEQQDQEQQDQENQEQQDQENQDQQDQENQDQQDQENQDQQDQENQDQQDQQNQDQQDQQNQDQQDQQNQDQQDPQEQQQDQQGQSGEPDETEAPGTTERSLPADQERVLDALQDSEDNLERARARARGQRENRRPAQDW